MGRYGVIKQPHGKQFASSMNGTADALPAIGGLSLNDVTIFDAQSHEVIDKCYKNFDIS